MAERSAKVIGRTDGGFPQRFVDEYGDHWVYAADAMTGHVAVDRCTDEGEVTGDGAGVFEWTAGSEDSGTIWLKTEGDTYDANNPEEFVVEDGQWVRNEENAEVEAE